jgi:hypothetical protein
MTGGLAPEGLKLYKFYLRPPETRGASGEMRVLALVNEADRVIELLMAYTHADYPKQPHPEEILQRIEEG